MDAAERLVAIEDIKALKARYFRCMDTKQWDAFADLFTDDASIDVSGEMRASAKDDNTDLGIVRGKTEIAAFVQNAINDVTTVHHGHTPEIDVLSPTHATGVWAMEDKLRWPAGAPLQSMHGYGHYHDTYESHDGRWLIASLKLTRLRVDVDMPATG